MAAFIVDPDRVRAFANFDGFYEWLSAHHAAEPEVWIRIYKRRSGWPSVTLEQAIEAALCWGWIDGIRKAGDEQSFLQRYSPRRTLSNWSLINARSVHRLSGQGLMQLSGLGAARAGVGKGRWPMEVETP